MYDLAADFLTAVAEAMATTEAGGPARQFVSLGAPLWETGCAQASVQVLTLTEESTRDLSPAMQTGLRHARGRVNLVGFVAYAVRCVTVSEGNQNVYQPQSDATLSAEAKAAYEDGWAIWNYVTEAIRQDVLFGGPCGDVHFDLGVPFNPQGGLAGWQFTIRAELNGYRPMLAS